MKMAMRVQPIDSVSFVTRLRSSWFAFMFVAIERSEKMCLGEI